MPNKLYTASAPPPAPDDESDARYMPSAPFTPSAPSDDAHADYAAPAPSDAAASAAPNPFADTITGVLERVTYHNEDNGYTIGRLAVEGARDLITIVGNFSNPVVGEQLFCEGKWTAHKEYGRQFSIERYNTTKPATAFAIEKYLGSGLIKGIGPVMAKRMVDLFSLDTLDVIEHEPRKLLRVEGIGEKRIEKIQKAWHEQREIRNVMLFLQGHGVSATYAVKIYKTYGDKAIKTVEENPYRLAQDIWGIGFKTADKIAQQMGVAPDSEQRLEAGLLYTLSEATDFGHLFLPEPKLLTSAADILGVETDIIAPVMENMAASEAVIAEEVEGVEMAGRAMRAFYHPALYYTEVGLAAQIRRRLNQEPGKPVNRAKIGKWIAQQEAQSGIALSDEQREAVYLALEKRFLVLTGGPGTGKCIRGDSLVLTANGFVPLQAQWPGEQPLIPDTYCEHRADVVAKDGMAQASHLYYGGAQQTIHIKTHLGLELEGTPNHRVWAMTPNGPGWLRLDALTPDTYVAIRRGDDVWGQNPLDPEVAYLYGVISGDGSQASRSKLSITNNDTALLERCAAALRTHFHVQPRCNPSRNTFDLYVYNTAFRVRLEEIGFTVCKSEGKTIPPCVMQAPRAAVVQYLAGLFDTDGCIHQRAGGHVVFEITLKSKKLIQQVQMLLLNLGIVGRYAEKCINYRYSGLTETNDRRSYWRLFVYGADVNRLMQVVPTRKAVVSQARVINTNRDIVPLPGALLRCLFTCDGRRTRREWWPWKREIKGERKPTRIRVLGLLQQRGDALEQSDRQLLEEACRSCYYWDRVTDCQGGCAPVYDFAVPGQESFVANGFVNHNTSVTNLIARAFDAQHKQLVLVSPTGRAAKRLSEVTGREAQTIHRLLKFDPATHSFQYNESNPLPCDVLIADEVSMLDAVLANNLLKAIPEHAQIVFVGDSDQLPSVGAGNVLGDLLSSDVVPSIRLTQVFRQAQESLIVTNAHKIRKGEFPTLIAPKERAGRNMVFVEVEEGEEGADRVVALARKSLPALGFKGDDVQVLSPLKKGSMGVDYLNLRLQEALNPADPTGRRPELLRGSRRFRIGDRVIQLVNNYDKNVFNGDVGTITDIKPDDQVLFVRYGDETVDYDFADYDELQLAYSLSIHKSQGSEYRAVVMVMHSSQYMMLQRNLLYTGLTRARDLCILVGDKKAIARAVKNDKTTRRYTRLADRLKEQKDTFAQNAAAASELDY